MPKKKASARKVIAAVKKARRSIGVKTTIPKSGVRNATAIKTAKTSSRPLPDPDSPDPDSIDFESKDSQPDSNPYSPPKVNGQTTNAFIKHSGRNKKPVFSKKEAGQRFKARMGAYQRDVHLATREVAPVPFEKINWERRNACSRNLRLFSETYLPSVFFMGWSDDQLRCIKKAAEVILERGMFAMAMPRAGGKTAICRSALIFATAYGHRRFPFFIGSSEEKTNQTLDFIKMYWFQSRLLRQDFPEIGYPALHLENKGHASKGQLFNGQPTHIEWTAGSLRYPSLLFPPEIYRLYEKNDPDSLIYLEKITGEDLAITRNAGIKINVSGIDGSIRGEAEVHPITLEQVRPDLVFLDDIQKDQKAESPAACEKMIRLIDGAIQGLSGPGRHISALMPCTVIREGDVSDTYLDPSKKPDWKPERCSMVTSWPPGITDYEITLETEEGELWNKYNELRRESLRRFGDFRMATALYKTNRKVMDNNFTVSWAERYDAKAGELSAQQHAMNLRFKSPDTFPSEFQNKGRRLYGDGPSLITPAQLAEKTVPTPRRHVPVEAQYITSFIDVQNEILFYATLAVSPDFTGVFVDYGTWPSINSRFFHKYQTEGWTMVTTQFFKDYPQYRPSAMRDASGKYVAPFEGKIYYAVRQAIIHCKSLRYTKEDGNTAKVGRIAVDTRWGKAAEYIKRAVYDFDDKDVVPYNGQAFPITRKQLEDYELRPGWLFEHQLNTEVREPKWVYRPGKDGRFYLQCDVSRTKDFLMSRLASPPGSPGSISLFKAPAEDHEMFSEHVCGSEYPIAVSAQGKIKNQWEVREGKDNDWLDCAVGCITLCSTLGASYKTSDATSQVIYRSLSQAYQTKQRYRSRE